MYSGVEGYVSTYTVKTYNSVCKRKIVRCGSATIASDRPNSRDVATAFFMTWDVKSTAYVMFDKFDV